MIVDEVAHVHRLGRQVLTADAKELRAFMADIDREALPTVNQARAMQEQAALLKTPIQRANDTARLHNFLFILLFVFF